MCHKCVIIQPAGEKLCISRGCIASCSGEQPTAWEELVGDEVSWLPHTPAWPLIPFIIIYANTLYKQSSSREVFLFIV